MTWSACGLSATAELLATDSSQVWSHGKGFFWDLAHDNCHKNTRVNGQLTVKNSRSYGSLVWRTSSSRMRFMSHNRSATKQVSSSVECSRDKPPISFVRGQDSTTRDIVWVSPQGHRSVSVSRHFLLQAPQCPCSVRKRFSRDHCWRGRSKPVCRIVGSHTRWEWWVPEMRRVIEFNCTSTWLVWAERDQTARQRRSTLLLNSKAPEQMTAVLALAPQVEPASFINKLFRFFSLPVLMHYQTDRETARDRNLRSVICP